MAAQQICQVRACSSVGDVDKLDTGHAGKEFAGDVAYCADFRRSKFRRESSLPRARPHVDGLAVTGLESDSQRREPAENVGTLAARSGASMIQSH